MYIEKQAPWRLQTNSQVSSIVLHSILVWTSVYLIENQTCITYNVAHQFNQVFFMYVCALVCVDAVSFGCETDSIGVTYILHIAVHVLR